MAIPIQLKRNGTAASTPSSLLHGEVALNYADGKLFWKDASNVIQSFTFQAYALSSHTHAASDITSGTLDAARIANDSITYAKLQNVSTTDRLLGRSSAGAGDVEEVTCTAFGRSLIDDADAAAARTTLSVQPTASPAFTGAATVTNDGNVVPLTVTNTGTANSFVVNDASGDTTPFVIDASGRVVIGASQAPFNQDTVSIVGVLQSTGTVSNGFVVRGNVPSDATAACSAFLSVAGTAEASFTITNLRHFLAAQGTFGSGSTVTNQYGFWALSNLTGATNNYGFYSDIASGSGRWNFYSNGTAPSFFGGQLLVTAGSASAPGVAISGDPDTGIAQLSAAGANTLSICTNSAERVRVDASGNVGIGGAAFYALDVQRTSADAILNVQTTTSGNAQLRIECAGNASSTITQNRTSNNLEITNGSSGSIVFTNNGSERVRVKATGSVRFVPLSADPSTGNEAGDVYYNSTTNKLRVYNGTSWVDLH